jgi:hypothetical protein
MSWRAARPVLPHIRIVQVPEIASPDDRVCMTLRWRESDSNYRFRGSDRDQRGQWDCDLKKRYPVAGNLL